MSLSEARLKARELRQQLLDGIDPLAAKQTRRNAAKLEAARAVTFQDAAEHYLRRTRPNGAAPTTGINGERRWPIMPTPSLAACRSPTSTFL